MRNKAILHSIVIIGLMICMLGTPLLASANSPHKIVPSDYTPEQAAIHYPDIIERHSPVSNDALAYSWFQVASPDNYPLTSVDMVSPEDGWAVGYMGRYSNGTPYGQVILRYEGYEWYEWNIAIDYNPLYSIAMDSGNDGWTAGGSIFRWDGSDWNLVDNPSGRTLRSVSIVTEDDAWAVTGSGLCIAGNPYSAAFVHWDGSSWSQFGNVMNDYFLYSVNMISAVDGWAVGGYCHYGTPSSYENVIMRWNGSSWVAVSAPTVFALHSVDMISATDGWAVGNNGLILHWNGSNWSEAGSPASNDLNSVAMVSSNNGWAVGDDGIILHWDGSDWSQVASPVSVDLNSINLLSSEDGWVVGEEGTILRYTSPDQLVRVVGAGTADEEWNFKVQFQPGDTIRYYIEIINSTGADAQIELTYSAKGPNNETAFYDQYTETIPSGYWYWGNDGIAPENMSGTYTFTGSGLYLGTTTQAEATYTVGLQFSYLPLIIR
jgi:hypothetical protein